jgi:hypothetical protein
MERFLGRCMGLVIRLQGVVPTSSLDEAQHLMEHGEPAEGVRTIAWGIVENGLRVPAEVVRDIRDLTAELIADDDMPPNLDAFVDE